jgi:hypothetical protein
MNAPIIRGKIVIREVDLIDANECARIDAWVMTQSDCLPFHRPKWLNAVQAGTGQAARCFIAERGDQIAGILPCHIMHSPLFGRALVSSGFAVGGGILFNSGAAWRGIARRRMDRKT